jgi:hypothetical protein
MKLGDLASILEKDALELGKAYEITELETELDLETVSKILNPEITQLKKSLRVAAKNEGYQMAERTIKTDIEKRMKTEFGIDGADMDSLFSGIKSQIKPRDSKDDDKLKIEFQRVQSQKEALEKEFSTFKTNIETEKKKGDQFAIFNELFSKKFDVSSENLRKMAFNGFLEKFDIEKGEKSSFAIDKKTNKPLHTELEDLIFESFKEDFKVKETKAQHPTGFQGAFDPTKAVSFGATQGELLAQLRTEKDPNVRQQINTKLKALSS